MLPGRRGPASSFSHGAHAHAAAAGLIGSSIEARLDGDAAGREVGPGTRSQQVFGGGVGLRSSSSWQASISSPTLCGGIEVAMPTAMPDEPLASRLGKPAGRTTGSSSWPS
jgi:hypothetical protein